MKADYILTTFSPAMFGEGATAHIKVVELAEAQALVHEHTRIVATRVPHDRLARTQFPGAASETARYANLRPGVVAVHMHYRGPNVGEDGRLPVGGMITPYLLEVEEYQVAE